LDLTRRETMVLLPLLVAMFAFGVWPNVVLCDLHCSVSTLLYS
jgi:NADH:ubiquinone oxidoreductase subunit 4 (subunit M)